MPTPLVVSLWIKVCLAGMASTATCTLVYPIPFTLNRCHAPAWAIAKPMRYVPTPIGWISILAGIRCPRARTQRAEDSAGALRPRAARGLPRIAISPHGPGLSDGFAVSRDG